MSRLTAAERNALPDEAFGLPSERKYPMPDKSHARDAKAWETLRKLKKKKTIREPIAF